MKNQKRLRREGMLREGALRAGCLSGGVGLVAVMACAHPAIAQDAQGKASSNILEEVTVTAQRRTQRSLDVPIAITALGSEQLGQGGIQKLSDIQQLTPGLRFDSTGAFPQPTIRGVGTAVVVAGGSSNVGVYTDGFYAPSPLLADQELLNVESVQVLKGPQGTLFGRNSTGGAILVTTSDPSSEESGKLKVSYGNYNTQRYSVYATGGPSEKLAFDVAGLVRQSDGYVTNISTGKDTDAAYNNKMGRVGAKFQPTDALSVLLRLSYVNTDDNSMLATNTYVKDGQPLATAATFGLPVATRSDEVINGFKPRFNAEGDSAELTVKWDLDFAMLTSYTQYAEIDSTHYENFGMSSVSIYDFIFDTKERVFSQELLLASSGDGPLQWTTGLFYLENTSLFENNRGSIQGGPFFPAGGSTVDVGSVAAFADMTYALRDDLFLTLGVRYSRDDATNAYMQVADPVTSTLFKLHPSDIHDNQTTPRVALRYEINDDSSTYVSYSEGYKPGILNVGGNTLTGVEVKPEKIKAYEIGYKYSSGDLKLDLATYYYDYTDLQVASYVGPTSVIKNAADSHIYGVEGQVRYALTEKLEVNVGANYLDAQYDNFDQSQAWSQCSDLAMCGTSYGIYIPRYVDASHKEMQHSPTFTGNLGLNYSTDLARGLLKLSGTLYHTSDFYFDSSENYKEDAYNLLGVRVEWTDPTDTYTVALFGDNLTDTKYHNQVLPQFYGTLTTWGAPRTGGVSLQYNF